MAEIKRLNYFTSQFLVEQDFTDEQAYHVAMRRRLNQVLHTWGVAQGLLVTRTADKQVSVSSGVAIDNEGRDIVLLDSATPVPMSIPVGTPLPTDVYLTIAYHETFDPADHYVSGPIDNYTRTTEAPDLEIATSAPPNDGTLILLAKINLDGSGNINTIDASIRKMAGSVIPAATDLAVNSLTANTVTVQGDVAVAGMVAGRHVATDGANLDAHLAIVHGNPHGTTAAQVGALPIAGGGVLGNLTVSGLIGIGTTTPGAPLDVRGQIRCNSLAITDSTGALYPDNWIGMASNIDAATKWLHIGGITDSGARRLALMADRIFISGGLGIGTAQPDRSLTLANALGANYLNVKDGTREILVGVDATAGGVGILSVMSNNDLVLRAGVNNEKVRITAGGNVGIGTATPGKKLDIAGGAVRIGNGHVITNNANGALVLNAGPADASNLAGIWFRKTTTLGDETAFTELMRITVGGNVGIGTTAPVQRLAVSGTESTPNGFGAAIGLSNVAAGGANWYLRAGAAGTSTPAAGFSIADDIAYRLVIQPSGNCGIGITNPGYALDVGDRVRLRQGGSGTAGLFLYQSAPASDRAFIGMMTDNVVGFWGPSIGWGLRWDNGTGNLWVQGSIAAAGGKGGYVMDQFINSRGEALEQGDVVVIGQNQASAYYGVNDTIPIPEVDATDRAGDPRVCGIVCAVHAETTAPSPSTTPNPEPTKQTETTQAAPPGRAGAAPLLDGSKVAPGQVGWMVTLGAYAHCKVDADTGPIAVGDLLMTSATKGYAQKALDPAKATGAILGKALGSLGKGKGKIPVLVTLQ
jgi:hypothetical protein